MSLQALGTQKAATLSSNATVADAARLMEDENVGSIVIVDDDRPVSIVTDRDLVLKVIRRRLDPDDTRLSKIMADHLITATDDTPLDEAAWRMREHAIRRLPVVDGEGRLIGINPYGQPGVEGYKSHMNAILRR